MQEVQSLLERGDRVRARAYARRLCEQNPNDIEAWMLFGNICANSGDVSGARRCFSRVASTNPAHAGALFNLGIIEQQQGNFPEAAEFYQKALQREPAHLPAMLNLAFLFRGVGDFANALECLNRAIALQPDSANIHYNRALVAQAMGNYEGAGNDYRKAVQLEPSASQYRLALGKLLDIQGRFGESMHAFQCVLSLAPGNEQAVAAMATSLERQKHYQAAYESIRPFMEQGSKSGEIARAFASVSQHVGQSREAIDHIERLLASPQLTPGLRADLGFSLGHLYDRTGQFDNAFASFRAANELLPGQFDERLLVEFTDSQIEVFSAESLNGFPRVDNASQLPVFIVGMPRSGTSLVEQILAAHPQVAAVGELPDIGEFTRRMPAMLKTSEVYPACMHEFTRDVCNALSRRYLERLQDLSRGARRVTNKMPHNFQCLGLIDLLFPGTRVIHVTRNPVDTCLSLYFQSFNAAHAYTSDLGDLGRYYRQYLRIMAHWRRVLRIPLLEVAYEDLVTNQEAVTRRVLDFCNLHWDRRCLDYHEIDRFVGTPSYNQVRRPVYSSSVDRWKNYEKYLEPLISTLQVDQQDH